MKHYLVILLLGVCYLQHAGGQTRLCGADISLIPAYEAAGDVWLDENGASINAGYDEGLIGYLRDAAELNAMRVRLLVEPDNDSYLATCQDLEYVTALGKRIKDAGLTFLLDIFYSDTWADCSQQWIPNSWNMGRNTDTSELAAKVKSYTTETLNTLVEAGATPDYVQIGNEISYGFLWDSLTSKNKNSWFFSLGVSYSSVESKVERFATLLNAAAEGVRESQAGDALIVLHSERTLSADQTYNFYSWLESAGFNDYDVIGLSYYPAWHGGLSELDATLSRVEKAWPSKPIQIVETAYFHNSYPASGLSTTEKSYCTWDFTPAGQAAFLSDLIETLGGHGNVNGLYYWQIEECGNGASSAGTNRVMDSWDNRSFWELTWKSGTHALESYDALMTLKEFYEASGIEQVTESASLQVSESATYNLAGQRVNDDNQGVIIRNGRKILK